MVIYRSGKMGTTNFLVFHINNFTFFKDSLKYLDYKIIKM